MTASSGEYAEENPFRFSSEYSDMETGLVYYNYRYYSPELGRWLSRDPIEEQGGYNLYGMVGNGIVNNWDRQGHGPLGFIFGWLKCIYNVHKWKENCEKQLPDCSDPCMLADEQAECFKRRAEGIKKCMIGSQEMLKACFAGAGKF